MILCNVTEQAVVLLRRVSRFPEVIVACFGVVLVKFALPVGQSGEVEVDRSNVSVVGRFEAPKDEVA